MNRPSSNVKDALALACVAMMALFGLLPAPALAAEPAASLRQAKLRRINKLVPFKAGHLDGVRDLKARQSKLGMPSEREK